MFALLRCGLTWMGRAFLLLPPLNIMADPLVTNLDHEDTGQPLGMTVP